MSIKHFIHYDKDDHTIYIGKETDKFKKNKVSRAFTKYHLLDYKINKRTRLPKLIIALLSIAVFCVVVGGLIFLGIFMATNGITEISFGK